VLNCFTFFVFTSFVFMKIFQDSTTSILNYYFIYMYLLHYFTNQLLSWNMCLYEDAMREDILSRYPCISLLSAVSILSYRSVPYFMYWFRVQIFDSDSGSWLYVLGPIMNCMDLVWIDLDFINTCNLNASFIHI
jgi:hypothetical protein